MHLSCFPNGSILNTTILLFSLEGRKIPRKLRFIVPLTCIYPVQTRLLTSQTTTELLCIKLNPLSHRKQINK